MYSGLEETASSKKSMCKLIEEQVNIDDTHADVELEIRTLKRETKAIELQTCGTAGQKRFRVTDDVMFDLEGS